MKILVTGSSGFIGKNLTAELRNRGYDVLPFDVDTDPDLLDQYAAEAGFVFHLAGVNRPESAAEFISENVDFTARLLNKLDGIPIMLASSAQAELPNPYGDSKKKAEELVFDYGWRTGLPVYVYRFPGVFGKWGRPNYNSAVATFCYNIARGLPVTVSDPEKPLTLVYIDDLVNELIAALEDIAPEGGANRLPDGYCGVAETYEVTLGRLTELLYGFETGRREKALPDTADPFVKKLYATYLSYLPEDGFAVPLHRHADDRGSFTEIFRTPDRGQLSVNTAKPGVVKGSHWHHTKCEKFLVVSGEGVIRFRLIGGEEVLDYPVSGDNPEVVDIPAGYTHSIENTGDTDLVTLIWANEEFDPERPDTYTEKV